MYLYKMRNVWSQHLTNIFFIKFKDSICYLQPCNTRELKYPEAIEEETH